MTKLEVQEILLRAERMTFLDTIEYLSENEKDYKKSELYKTTKIPLFTLYEKYFMYVQAKESFDEKFENFILGLDLDMLEEQAMKFIEKLSNNKRFAMLIDSVIEKFDTGVIMEESEELKKLFKKIKN